MMGNNPTPQNWSDTTTGQKVNINNGVILSKASYFNFAASKSYVETARSGGLIIDPDILKQRFYEDLITGEYDPANGYFKNGLTEKEAAYVANNYVYHGTGLSGEEDQLTMLSSVDDPNERYVISSGSNSVEEKRINNPRTAVGSTTGDLGQDIKALTGDNSAITFGKTLDPNNTYNFVGHSNGGARSVETAQWFFDNGFTIGEILAYNSPGTPYGRWEDRPNPNSNFGGTHRVWVSLDRPIADKITYITNGEGWEVTSWINDRQGTEIIIGDDTNGLNFGAHRILPLSDKIRGLVDQEATLLGYRFALDNSPTPPGVDSSLSQISDANSFYNSVYRAVRDYQFSALVSGTIPLGDTQSFASANGETTNVSFIERDGVKIVVVEKIRRNAQGDITSSTEEEYIRDGGGISKTSDVATKFDPLTGEKTSVDGYKAIINRDAATNALTISYNSDPFHPNSYEPIISPIRLIKFLHMSRIGDIISSTE